MVTALIAIPTMIVVLGIMIVIHELGHHWMAKFFGVRVDVFSVGFGKRLFGFVYNGTDYRVSALPFGGYVKMAGMDFVESRVESQSDDPGEFMNHPRWQRIMIAMAGPAANIVLAVALLTGVFMVRYEHPLFLEMPAVIGSVLPDSAAAKLGLQSGDKIVRIESVQNPNWEDVDLKALLSPHSPLDIAVQRGNSISQYKITPQPVDNQDIGLGLVPKQPIIVTDLRENMPAFKAGLRKRDEILAINSEPMHSMVAIQNYTKNNGEKPMQISVLRDGQIVNLSITPVMDESDGAKTFRMGFGSNPVHIDKLPFTQALTKSIEQNKKFSFLIVELVQKMVERKVSIKQVDGPLRIGQEAGRAVQEPGWTPILSLMAAISLNLGVFNLLPIPILDGGLILLTLIESAIRRDIDQRVKERIYQTAFVFLVVFAAIVMYNDVTKL